MQSCSVLDGFIRRADWKKMSDHIQSGQALKSTPLSTKPCYTIWSGGADSVPCSTTNKGKTSPSGLAFFAYYRVFARVPAGSCGVRRAAFLPATSRFYSPFAHSLSDPPHPAQAKARKARPSPLFKSTGYPRTNQSVFLWPW